jgi:hypothetical protein
MHKIRYLFNQPSFTLLVGVLSLLFFSVPFLSPTDTMDSITLFFYLFFAWAVLIGLLVARSKNTYHS